MSDEYKERLRRIRKEADKVLFSDGGKHWPIFRVKDDLYEDFWPFFERYLKAIQRLDRHWVYLHKIFIACRFCSLI